MDAKILLDNQVDAAALKILAVDDSSTNRLILTRLMQAMGHQVETAVDGERAIEATAGGDFDVILMDVQMPGIGGVEAARRIRELAGPTARTPIIAVTADASALDRDAYLDAGMSAVVAKPLSAVALQAAIAQVARR